MLILLEDVQSWERASCPRRMYNDVAEFLDHQNQQLQETRLIRVAWAWAPRRSDLLLIPLFGMNPLLGEESTAAPVPARCPPETTVRPWGTSICCQDAAVLGSPSSVLESRWRRTPVSNPHVCFVALGCRGTGSFEGGRPGTRGDRAVPVGGASRAPRGEGVWWEGRPGLPDSKRVGFLAPCRLLRRRTNSVGMEIVKGA